ncbi:MAG: hypothetical protein P4M11_03375 [Candidatus Pacebacteria bacterium]|nr:hypothetical protein [Candidatus Paceibacterota bacterium]
MQRSTFSDCTVTNQFIGSPAFPCIIGADWLVARSYMHAKSPTMVSTAPSDKLGARFGGSHQAAAGP